MICSGRNLQLQAPVRVRVFDAKCRCWAKCRIKILIRKMLSKTAGENFGANDLFWLYLSPVKAFKILEHLLCCLVPGAMSAKGLQNLRGAPLRAVHWVRESTFSWKNYPNDVPRRDIVGWKRERWRTMAYYKQNHTSKETPKQSHGDLKSLRYSNIWDCGWKSKNRGGPPKWMVKIMENPIKMDDLGVPLFSETPMYRFY